MLMFVFAENIFKQTVIFFFLEIWCFLRAVSEIKHVGWFLPAALSQHLEER